MKCEASSSFVILYNEELERIDAMTYTSCRLKPRKSVQLAAHQVVMTQVGK